MAKNRRSYDRRVGRASSSAPPAVPRGKRNRGEVGRRRDYVPPEDWHEPAERDEIQVLVQNPGPGYRHVVTADEVIARLEELPPAHTAPLEVVQLSRMTRKKRRFPCYGMQWGTSLYLYPIEENLVEYFSRPPHPAQRIEARMYGGRWRQEPGGLWTLHWTPQAVRDFYLHNVLIHELGHLLDDRNSNYTDRERYAEWFAIEHGYRKSSASRGAKRVRRRHHRS